MATSVALVPAEVGVSPAHGPTAGHSHRVCRTVRELSDMAKSVDDVPVEFMSTDDKSRALIDLGRLEAQISGLRMRILACSDDVAAREGARDPGAWLASATRTRRADAAITWRLAAALTNHPFTARALALGDISTTQAIAITRALGDLVSHPDITVDDCVLRRAERELVALAERFDAADLARLGRRILDTVAPEIAERAEARALADLERHARHAMRLSMRRLGDGTTRISARIPDLDATRLATYLHAFTNPRRDTGDSTASGRGAPLPHGRRSAEAFCSLLESCDPARLPIHGGDSTHVVITMTLDALREELGLASISVDDDAHDRITAAQARRLACTARLIPAVLGGRSEVLDLGRSRRLHSPAQRRAMALRDQHCRAEGCTVPSPWCESHHLKPWSQGGATTVDDGALLCSHHHHLVHDPDVEHVALGDGRIRFRRGSAGGASRQGPPPQSAP